MRTRFWATVATVTVMTLATALLPAQAQQHTSPACSKPGAVKLSGTHFLACKKWHGALVWRPATAAQIVAYKKTHAGSPSTSTTAKEMANCYKNMYDAPANYFTRHGTPTFTTLPFPVEILSSIVPMGAAGSGPKVDAGTGAGAHNLPSDHSSPAFITRDAHPTFAVADGTLVAVDFVSGRWDSGTPGVRLDDYGLVFQFSANFFLQMTHFTSLDPSLLAAVGPLRSGSRNSVRVPVKAGTPLGATAGAPFLGTTDFWAIDFDTPSAAPAQTRNLYGVCENHSVDPYQFFVEPYRSQLRAKLPNRPEPRVGQYMFDQLGGLYGNWWKESDVVDGKSQSGPVFAFFLNNNDPSVVMVGNIGTNTTDTVSGPDPATVPVGGAPVTYTLTNYMGVNVAFDYGLMLIQRPTATRIRVQIFPNARPGDAIAFDGRAGTFAR